MQIVIDLSEKYYNDICNNKTASNYSVLNALDGIRNGTPLPKGHGRLIDADALIFNADYYEPLISKRDFDFAPTIIEADKEK